MGFLSQIALLVIAIYFFLSNDGLRAEALEIGESCKTYGGQLHGYCAKLSACEPVWRRWKRSRLGSLRRQIWENKKICNRASNNQIDGDIEICCSRKQLDAAFKQISDTKLPGRAVCGIPATGRIGGGEATTEKEFPWAVLMRYRSRSNSINAEPSPGCGGTLISNRFVLTVAHCIKFDENSGKMLVDVLIGEWNISDAKPPQYIQGYDKLIPHPLFPLDGYDIGLIKLDANVVFNDYVQPICMPTTPPLRELPWYDTKMTAVGWGKTTTSNNNMSDICRKLSLWFVSEGICRRKYEWEKKMSSNVLCASGNSHADTCLGDSGGPLMVLYDTMKVQFWTLIGVISGGQRNCAMEDLPGIYTRVAPFMDWILIHLR